MRVTHWHQLEWPGDGVRTEIDNADELSDRDGLVYLNKYAHQVPNQTFNIKKLVFQRINKVIRGLYQDIRMSLYV